MKKYHTTPSNISALLLGKITRKPIWIRRERYILITDKRDIPCGYAAIIAKNVPKNQRRIPILYNLEGVEHLNDGDIISIDPDGNVNVLYELNSPHNTLMTTERCNYSCIMCPQPKVANEDDKTHLNLKLISLMNRQTQSLGITGGEPTLIGDKLLDIISACKQKLPRTALTLLTNGMRFEDKEYARKISLIRHPDLVIDIPLYADTDTEHDAIIGAKGFYKTIKGLYNLALFEQKTGIRIVIHKMTYKRLPQLAEFIYRNFPFVFHVAFMQMETTGLASKNIDQLWIDPYDYNDQLKRAVDFLFNRNMNVSIYNAQLCVIPESLWRFTRKSISAWKNIYFEQCVQCFHRAECGGFFESSAEKHSEHIKPMKQ